jgi:uncharacterized caspase-like protein
MQMFRCFLLALSLYLMFAPAGAFEEGAARYALVIGNQRYQVSPLRNSINDAETIAASLEKLGFEVRIARNVEKAELRDEIKAFYIDIERRGARNSIAVVYYAGHAIQINHRNYLVPIGIQLGDVKSFLAGLFDINQLFAEIPKAMRIQNIIILDACRNNPFGDIDGADNTLSIADGLAPLRAPPGTLIAYATEPGSVASDGSGKNGVYTKHLLRHLEKQTVVEELFKKVRKGVAKETRNRQIPWEHSSLLEQVYLNPPRNRQLPELLTF